MKLPRRQFLHLAAGAAAFPAGTRMASAQAYPARQVRIVVGFTAGGSTDIGARLIAQWLQERLGQPFVVENRPGAGTNIATDRWCARVARRLHAADERPVERRQRHAVQQPEFRVSARHRAGTASLPRSRKSMLANPSLSAQSVPELIAYAKANPGKITLASAGTGSTRPSGRRTVPECWPASNSCTCRIAAPGRRDDLLGGQVLPRSPRHRRLRSAYIKRRPAAGLGGDHRGARRRCRTFRR